MLLHRKILFLPRWYPTAYDVQNGVFIRKHAQAAALNNEVVVLFASSSPFQPQTTQKKHGNLTEVIVYYERNSFPLLNFIKYLTALFKGWRTIRRAGFQPELCHVNMLTRPALLALWLKWKAGIPFVITEHWSGYISGKFESQSPLKKWLIRYVVKKASLVTAVSEPLKEAMIRSELNAPIRILPNVVEVTPDAWRTQPVSDTFRFLLVADLKDEIKNISGVIRAFAEVHKKEPMTELLIVGDGEDRKALETMMKKYFAGTSLQPVKFVGEKANEEVLKIIPTAHVLIVNSRIETFSVVTLEAIFSGRPVIATRCGGPEQFINEQNGILIEKDNENELAEAMIKLKLEYNQYPPGKVKNSIPDIYNLNSISAVLNNYYTISSPRFSAL